MLYLKSKKNFTDKFKENTINYIVNFSNRTISARQYTHFSCFGSKKKIKSATTIYTLKMNDADILKYLSAW